MSGAPSIVWFRQALRLDDNPALVAAAGSGPVLPLFIYPGDEELPWKPGSASAWWQRRSLRALEEQLRRRGASLVLRSGPVGATLLQIARAAGARRIHCNRRYEPAVAANDRQLQRELAQSGIKLQFHDSALLFDPDSLLNQQGGPYRVFTPFWNRCLQGPPPSPPLDAPRHVAMPEAWSNTPTQDGDPTPALADFTSSLARHWQPGEPNGRGVLDSFLLAPLLHYLQDRDHPQVNGTSRLAPYLHFGELSPRRVWQLVHERFSTDGDPQHARAAEGFLRQLVWREFAYYILHHFPQTPTQPSNEQFARFPWRRDARAMQAWQQGRTGYPMVDAGMRQLLETGWMHNRLRMIVASFLTKHLLLSWQSGAEWFWERLVDADLANNTFGWQWAAGCGHDAAPYFRIFNPVLQGQKFDPQGEYIRRWVPELATLPVRWIHQPWAAPPILLQSAGIKLGADYPRPIVDHAEARARALSALAFVRESRVNMARVPR